MQWRGRTIKESTSGFSSLQIWQSTPHFWSWFYMLKRKPIPVFSPYKLFSWSFPSQTANSLAWPLIPELAPCAPLLLHKPQCCAQRCPALPPHRGGGSSAEQGITAAPWELTPMEQCSAGVLEQVWLLANKLFVESWILLLITSSYTRLVTNTSSTLCLLDRW